MPIFKMLGDGVVQVLYEDATEWLLLLPEGDVNQLGGTGNFLWVSQPGRILLYDVEKRKLIRSVERGGGAATPHVLLSRDRSTLFALFSYKVPGGPPVPDQRSTLHTDILTIDVATARVLVDQKLDRGVRVDELRETANGQLIARSYSGTPGASRLWRIDPRTGETEEGRAPGQRALGHGSPDGRLWLRTDTRLAKQQVTRKRGMFRREVTTYFSPLVQLWETWPPRFVRWLPMGWTPENEMPPLHNRRQLADQAEEARIWSSIVEASESTPDDPAIEVNWPNDELRAQLSDRAYPRTPGSASQPRDQLADETIRRFVQQWRIFAHGDIHDRIWDWDPDGTGFWTQRQMIVRRVDIDGSVTAGEFVQVHGASPELLYHGSEALPDHRFHGRFVQGTAIFQDLTKGPAPPSAINMDSLLWSDRGGANDWDRTVRDRAEKLVATRDRISVTLAEWSELGVKRAIEDLRDKLVAELPLRRGPRVWVTFEHGGKQISERVFFETVTRKFPHTWPAIDGLLRDVCEVMSGGRTFLSQDFEVALLGHAARALGLLGQGRLDTVKRYYERMVDSEHETHFTRQTVPLLVEKLGWTAPVIDFVWWLMLRGATNGLDSYRDIWLGDGLGGTPAKRPAGWGMEEAIVRAYTPQQFAALTAETFGSPEVQGQHPPRYSYHGIDKLADTIDGRSEWLTQFLGLMQSTSDAS